MKKEEAHYEKGDLVVVTGGNAEYYYPKYINKIALVLCGLPTVAVEQELYELLIFAKGGKIVTMAVWADCFKRLDKVVAAKEERGRKQ